ncbi:hypothetical protein scyTo_0011913 [Scyliorhinus torazame]|uniref:RRM domain-containing protein n=1 Tax=Scyliorhinus torazame TaxID=75743 RepID=A0A401NY38_SCYTO|nr:hypothetical protein [Scyliorhinus torazame]
MVKLAKVDKKQGKPKKAALPPPPEDFEESTSEEETGKKESSEEEDEEEEDSEEESEEEKSTPKLAAAVTKNAKEEPEVDGNDEDEDESEEEEAMTTAPPLKTKKAGMVKAPDGDEDEDDEEESDEESEDEEEVEMVVPKKAEKRKKEQQKVNHSNAEIEGRTVRLDFSNKGHRGGDCPSKTLFVHSLSDDIIEETLKEAFEGAEIARIATDRESGRSKGFSFVDFPSEEDAKLAKGAIEDGEIDGCKITLDFARPKGENQRGNRGGFGGGFGGDFVGGFGGGFGRGRRAAVDLAAEVMVPEEAVVEVDLEDSEVERRLLKEIKSYLIRDCVTLCSDRASDCLTVGHSRILHGLAGYAIWSVVGAP